MANKSPTSKPPVKLENCIGSQRVKVAICEVYKTDHDVEVEISHIESLLGQVRFVDLSNRRYWRVMLVLFVVFIVLEGIVLFCTTSKADGYVRDTRDLFMIGSVITLLAGVLSFIFYIDRIDLAKERGDEVERFWHFVPVTTASAGLMSINLILVGSTGWYNSSLLPMLLATATFIIGLPRENSKASNIPVVFTFLLALVALFPSIAHSIFLLFGLDYHVFLRTDIKSLGEHTGYWLNSVSFVISAFATWILRQNSSRRIKT